MGRTNIELDDELVGRVMDRYQVGTKREAVDLALRRLVGEVMTKDQALGMEGFGWDDDLTEIRRRVVIQEIKL